MLEVAVEKAGAGEQDAPLSGGREPVRLTGKDLNLVADAVLLEEALELVRFADGDDGVLVAVQHEYGRHGGREALFHTGRHATGELDDGAEAAIPRGGGYGEIAAERDAEDADARGIDGGA